MSKPLITVCTIKGFAAELKVKENAPPQYFKPRTVPFALRDKVDTEIQRLEKERVLKKVESSDWVTPIVTVLQPAEKEFVVISK